MVALLLIGLPASATATSDEESPCKDWAAPADPGALDDRCWTHVTNEWLVNCVGPWMDRSEGNVGPVGYTAVYCKPPGGGPTATVSPLSPGADDRCTEWDGEEVDLGPLDEGCLVHIEDNPPNCVGPWTGTADGTAGPISFTWHYCKPPGGPHIEIASSAGPCHAENIVYEPPLYVWRSSSCYTVVELDLADGCSPSLVKRGAGNVQIYVWYCRPV